MIKNILSLLMLLSPLVKVFPQQQHLPNEAIYLLDGGFLRGTVLDTLNGQAKIRLSDNTVIELPVSLISHSRQKMDNEILLADGRVLLQNGFTSSVSFQMLSAHRSSSWDNSWRWGFGAHYVLGYQFRPKLAIGAGLGIDAHEYFFMPVFLDIKGALLKNEAGRAKHSKFNKKPKTQWFGGYHKNLNGLKRKIPFCYNLQLGYHFPAEGLFGNENPEEVKGGWMVSPSVGIIIPSRTGQALRLDAGYKFQRYSRTFPNRNWGDWVYRDKVLLKSFSTRLSWIF